MPAFELDGRLFWEGRLNDIIKTGGANVSPLEIDAVIRDHPGVKLTQTVGIPDELLGELVVGCIVPHEGVILSEDEIKPEKLTAMIREAFVTLSERGVQLFPDEIDRCRREREKQEREEK